MHGSKGMSSQTLSVTARNHPAGITGPCLSLSEVPPRCHGEPTCSSWATSTGYNERAHLNPRGVFPSVCASVDCSKWHRSIQRQSNRISNRRKGHIGETTYPEEGHLPVTHTAHVHPAISLHGQGALKLLGLAKEYLGICRCSLTFLSA